MKLNENLKNTFKKMGLKNPDDTISWLLGHHYGLKPTNISEHDLNLLVTSNKIERGTRGIKMNFDLFDTGEIAEGVKTYIKMFRERRLFGNEEVVKDRIKVIMEKFGYSMSQILKLAEFHLENEKFPRKPHYFLYKGRGKEILYPIKDTELEMSHTEQDDLDFIN